MMAPQIRPFTGHGPGNRAAKNAKPRGKRMEPLKTWRIIPPSQCGLPSSTLRSRARSDDLPVIRGSTKYIIRVIATVPTAPPRRMREIAGSPARLAGLQIRRASGAASRPKLVNISTLLA